MHEVRRFSGELCSYSEELNKIVSKNDPVDRINNLGETIFHTSGMLSARLGFTDIELNPLTIQKQIRLRSGIYRKFEKSQRILSQKAKYRNIKIIFEGTSYFEIDAIQAFELVPFVILDNSIKYSPDEQPVYVRFEDKGNNNLIVTISSLGPTIELNEKDRLFDRGFRGINAKKIINRW